MLVERILREKGSEVAAVDAGASIAEAVAELRRWNVGALVVRDGASVLAGIISERDIVRGLAEGGAGTLERQVRDLMTTDVRTVDRKAPVEELMQLMTDRRIRHVPVVERGELLGVISIGDVVKRRLEELETENGQLVDYVRVGR